jgi:hypothetical protein
MKRRKKPDHTQRARDAWTLLVKRAETVESPFTYGQICEPLGLHPLVARYFLGVIQDHCHQTGVPPLQALVVSKKSRLPGPGYDGSLIAKADHDRALIAVRQHKWPAKAPF